MDTFRRRRTLLIGLLAVVCGCRDAPSTPPEPSTPAEQSHEVRGVIVSLDPDSRRLEIEHEAIPDFVSASGERVGMPAMIMPFMAGAVIALNEFKVGDKVTFLVEVRLRSSSDLLIRRMSHLPLDAARNIGEPGSKATAVSTD